jgi:hypothetical protein
MNSYVILYNMTFSTTEGHRRSQAIYIAKNRDKSKLWSKAYYQRNKERIKEQRRARYAKKKADILALQNNPHTEQ